MSNFIWDAERKTRTGVAEAVFCQGKSNSDLQAIVEHNLAEQKALLMTRLSSEQWATLSPEIRQQLDYDLTSKTAIANLEPIVQSSKQVCIVCAGTSDVSVATEAQRTLRFNGIEAPLIADVGVAGLWRLLDNIEQIRQYKIIIAVAGMEGALFSVLAGLVSAPVIAVPTAVGYGVSADGQAALSSALASCAPGVMTVNINNGFGAAAAAVKIVRQYT
ncbi:1-(5-phosphoribosyl)-5-amino-4-imidazole-carboxylate (AIR) carboxylase [Catenovulum agarivorans DS-2]|uniref:1-(5-phosphoribosyl)-5-amino-4-imidazole-carboxylate (AIR) carboxylase n=1 Tax=Catenovulum agarivorans DS-2 TaxID=1328313 RepID=W7Q6L2_9ALTE|nr:nickel pincer cofactor biosynthesis protein LarB [Catenovulum agarivorans]EWH08414.1 1-(5-phosphoribosyl)-5-amino-4-imidazole-carboxylate (AIR) carboxylase [Catenovulum agarivorans DS-2]